MKHRQALPLGSRIAGFSAGAKQGRREFAEQAWQPIPRVLMAGLADSRHAKGGR